MIILEFVTLEQAHKWYASPEHALTIPMRQRASDPNMVFVEGVPPKRAG